MTIEIIIDRLILDGFELPQRERPLLETAVVTELTRLLAESGLNYHANLVRRQVDGGPMPHTNSHDSTQFGAQIAQSVYEGLT